MFGVSRYVVVAGSRRSITAKKNALRVHFLVNHHQHDVSDCVRLKATIAATTTSTNRSFNNTQSMKELYMNAPRITAVVLPPPSTSVDLPRFDDGRIAFASSSTTQLLRAALCFRLCQVPFLVEHSTALLQWSRSIFGNSLTDRVLKMTLFGHFCAGEDEERMQPVISRLRQAGVGSILDYVAEDDGGDASSSLSSQTQSSQTTANAREYDYESEAACDRHVLTFKRCIQDAATSAAVAAPSATNDHVDGRTQQHEGYAAIKVTALGNPKLLLRMSQAIVETKKLFEKFDKKGNGVITKSEFAESYNRFFRKDGGKDVHEIFEEFDKDGRGNIDYITWSMTLKPTDLPRITRMCQEVGPLAVATPTAEEVELIEAMYQRCYELAEEASRCGTRLLIDAEQVRYQPAIDNLVLDMQRKYNTVESSAESKPLIYNTYQCYLKDALDRLNTDLERSERYGFHFGAKLVRGAYMERERAVATQLGSPSPIHDSLTDTHECYNAALETLLRHSAVGAQKQPAPQRRVEVMCATHNQESIEKAILAMRKYGIRESSMSICFAQLYGMSDHLSFTLGKEGYRVFKYLPYGEVQEAIPYLLRRARENSAVVGAANFELDMISEELQRRFLRPLER